MVRCIGSSTPKNVTTKKTQRVGAPFLVSVGARGGHRFYKSMPPFPFRPNDERRDYSALRAGASAL